ncbi:MAG: hypothetical protein GX900_07615 [Clostridiaceae bacterium]|nr:hypothetical protein [Clostridiaceae bacterium]
MRVLAVGCHPDDLEIGCGGTLNKYVENGAEVFMCHVANGNLGHVEIPPAKLAVIRAAEAERAGEIIGATKVFSLDVGDSYVTEFDEAVVDQMTDVIREVRPDLIITHSDVDYMRDHVQVNRLVFNASFMSGIVQRRTTHPAFAPIVPIYYMDTLAGVGFEPTHYVDISGNIEVKLTALAAHDSQIAWMREHDNIDFLDFVRTCSRYRGYQCGVPFAEAFTTCRTWPRPDARNLLP